MSRKLESYIWFEKYRPSELKDLTLTKNHKTAFKKFISDKEIPHLIFEGPAGSGKTTISKLLINHIPSICLYLNASGKEDRSIETMQTKVKMFAGSRPPAGKLKIVFLDECFAKGSLVRTPDGDIPIEDIKVGDTVCNINGNDVVDKTPTNKVPLDRLAAVQLSSGDVTICSEDHKFLTSVGWVGAKNLDPTNILCYCDNTVSADLLSNEDTNEHMQILQSKDFTEQKILRKQLCSEIQVQDRKDTSHLREDMYKVLGTIYSKSTEWINLPFLQKCQFKVSGVWDALQRENRQELVLTKMSIKMAYAAQSESTRGVVLKGNTGKSQEGDQKVGGDSGRYRAQENAFGENEKPISFSTFKKILREGYRNQKNKRHAMDWKTWREWSLNRIAAIAIDSTREFMGVGTLCTDSPAHPHWRETPMVRKTPISHQLQDRHSTPYTNGGDRSGWQGTSKENKYFEGQQKNQKTASVRVESVTLYKQGSDAEHFSGIVGNTERNQGFIELHDLSVREHPSYIVNGCVVHNSDGMLKPAQESLKNIIETYNKSCRFILTCNHVDKIVEPLQSRCVRFTFDRFPIRKAVKVCSSILKSEGLEATPEQLTALVERFYPDMRSIVNNLQSACISGTFDETAIGALNVDPVKVMESVQKGHMLSIRKMCAGTTDFAFLYKYMYDQFLPNLECDNEVKNEIIFAIGESNRYDSSVPDRELEFMMCCSGIMAALDVTTDFNK